MSSLIPCPNCRRHLRRAESLCPFCSTSVAAAFENVPERPLPPGRLSRAALLTFAAASVAATACGGSTEGSDTSNQGVTDGSVGGSAGTGGDSSGGMTATGGGSNTGGMQSSGGTPNAGGTGGFLGTPVYGAPFPIDASTEEPTPDAAADASDDAADGSGGSPAAIYGAAPAYGISPTPGSG